MATSPPVENEVPVSQALIAAPRTSAASRASTRAVRFAAPAIGAAASGVMLIGAGTPSYWGDEAASVMSAQRPLWSLWQELGNIDAVHGTYYLFLHLWTQVVGTSEFATRAPSAVAAGLAVAGVVVLGRILFGLRVGIVAGILMLALPEVTRVAVEARSYAFSMAAAVWVTVLLVALLRRGDTRRRWWALYTAGLALGAYLFLYVGLLIPVHAAMVVLLSSDSRGMLARWARWVALALVAAIPVVVAGIAQQHQIAFLADRHYASANAVLVRQWFHSVPLAVMAWVLIATGAGIAMWRRIARPATAAVLVWLLLPTAVLLAGDAWITPMYNFRYAGFCLPAVALAMAIGVTRVASLGRGRRRGILVSSIAVTLALALAAPVFATQRTEYAKDGGADLRQTASVVAALAQPGDAIVFDQTTKPSRRPRLALDLYPSSFTGLEDVALLTPYVNRSRIWDRVAPLDAIHARLAAYSSVIAVEADRSTSTDLAQLQGLGYVVVDEQHVHRTTVYRLERGTL